MAEVIDFAVQGHLLVRQRIASSEDQSILGWPMRPQSYASLVLVHFKIMRLVQAIALLEFAHVCAFVFEEDGLRHSRRERIRFDLNNIPNAVERRNSASVKANGPMHEAEHQDEHPKSKAPSGRNMNPVRVGSLD